MRLSYVLIFLALFCCTNLHSQIKNEDELKKQAETHFEAEEYDQAYKLYSQLVSLYPKDPNYNYKLGVCMLFTEPDKKKPYSYLQIALKNPEAPKEATFYLAKTYHVNYKFDEAIKLYTEYKKTATPANIKKLQVDREIDACRNGKRLLSNLSDLVIVTKKQLNEADYFRSYDIKDIGGKLLVKPEDFKTGYDKKKKDKSVVYLPRSGERLYYSSYGDNGDKGRDIYFVNKLPNGSWSKPQPMPAPINTAYDEDYPFLHPNGKTLYFSSKGHNSMGGYDLFKTTFNEETQTWSKPENLDFPINSPDDDILFVTDSLEKTAFFSTGRYSPYGKIDVLKISTERRPLNFAILKGTVVKEEVSQSLKSKITVKNMENGEIVGTFQAGENGDYNMELPNGGKFIFTVETPGIPTQSDGVQIPIAYSLKPYKQVISYDKKVLKIINYFDGQIADENYSLMTDLIEKRAKLEINEMDPRNNGIKDGNIKNGNNTNGNLNSVSTTNPTANGNDGNKNTANNTNKNVTNDQLLKMAQDDAKEAQNEANDLKQEAQDAFGLATQKTAEATEKQKEADEAITNANSITDTNKKNEELAKANQLKDEANIASNIANTATELATKLEVDANQKQKEADLTNEYIKELEIVTKNKNNKEAIAKLEEIQKQLDVLSNQKSQSDELLSSLKAESNLKQNEIKNSEKKSNAIVNEINSLKTEVKTLETDLFAENDKAIKENISAQIRELNNEIDTKNKELNTNNQKIENLNNQVQGLNKEIEIAANILNEKTDGVAINTNDNNKNGNQNNNNISNTNTAGNTNQNSNSISGNTNAGNNNGNSTSINNNQNNTNTNGNAINSNATALSSEKLIDKYTTEINQLNNNTASKDGLTNINNSLKNYNNDITSVINADKKELSKTGNPVEKQKLQDEIKTLEKIKSDNEKNIVANETKIKQLDSNALATNSNTISGNNNNANNANSNAISNTTTNANGNQNNTNSINNNNNSGNNTNGNSIANNNNNANSNQNTSTDINNNSNSANTTNSTAINNNSSDNANTNGNKIANTSGDNSSSNTNSIASQTNSAAGKEPLTTISANTANDNSAYLKALDDLKNNLNSTTGIAENLFSYNDYKEGTSVTLKQTATQKFNQSKQSETALKDLINKTESSIKSYTTSDPVALLNEAENLNNKAFELRKESATKTGTEKENLLKQAQDNEKQATTKKLEASVAQQKQNQSKFDNNSSNLSELQKLTGDKTSNEISQANMLIDEAALNFKQAQKLRTEANAYPTDAAKLGGIGNAEEKENEALLKQQKALELLSKVNPGFQAKPLNTNNPADAITVVNQAINNASQSQSDAYLALSKANQNELKLQGDKLSKNPALKNPANKQAQDLKTTSDNLNKEAQQLITQSATATNAAEKANLLFKANEKEVAAIKALNEANKALTTSAANTNIAATNTNTTSANNTAGNNTNNNGNNNNTNANNAVTTNTQTANTNSVAINNNSGQNTNTQSNSNTISNNSNSNGNANNAAITSNTTNPTVNVNIANTNDTDKLKAGLNNPGESSLTAFNAYSNPEAIDLKLKANEQINEALNEDKNLSARLDNIKQLSGNTTSGNLDQNSITALSSEAEKLNDEAFALRQASATKTGTDKENDIKAAKELEQKAIAKKMEAANKQQQFNNATYSANTQSLEELAKMAQGKNIPELNGAGMQLDEATLFIKQANNLRTEANAYPTDAAKLGGYSNAEEKELQAIAKQQAILDIYKKYFPDYKQKQATVTAANPEATARLNETKSGITNNAQKHIEGLTTLSQANAKEYAAKTSALPANLTANQNSIKTKAQAAYKKSQDLIAKANQTTDALQKKNTLVEANQSGQEAITLLNQISGSSAIAGNNNNTTGNTNANSNTTGNTNAGNNNSTTTAGNTSQNTAANNTTANANGNRNNPNTNSGNSTSNTNTAKLKVEGLEIKNNNAYSAANKIPIDQKIQDGLVFKVQVGAFKSPLPDNTFKGLTPVIAQTAPNGYLRYMAGNFEKYESASAVKNDLKNLGYSDAFVVAYYNGVRITLAEALEKLKASGQTVDMAAANNTSAGITGNTNVPRNTFTTTATAATIDNQPVETKELEQINGLLYTVQIGVFSKQVIRGQLYNLRPIYTEKLPNGLYRYTAGIYNQKDRLLEDKRKVVELGVKDAFVSAYYNAKRIPFAEGQKLQTENNNLKLEAQNPIIFPGNTGTAALPANTATTTTSQPVNNTTGTPAIAPFSNGVTTGPAPTADNGVKADEAGISFKVQIGAYKNQVPNDVASKFLNIKTWPVNNVVINGLYIYTIGNFTGTSFAKKLRDEAIALGITDAFITVYKDGKKLYGAEATQYLNQ